MSAKNWLANEVRRCYGFLKILILTTEKHKAELDDVSSRKKSRNSETARKTSRKATSSLPKTSLKNHPGKVAESLLKPPKGMPRNPLVLPVSQRKRIDRFQPV